MACPLAVTGLPVGMQFQCQPTERKMLRRGSNPARGTSAPYAPTYEHQEKIMRKTTWIAAVSLGLLAPVPACTQNPRPAPLANYFPPPESKGGWRTLLPAKGEPNDEEKAVIALKAGVDWDKLKLAWEHN